MEIIRKALKLSREEYYKKHLFLINPILPRQLTIKEAEVLAAFISLEGDIAKDPFGTTGRKLVMSKCNIKPGGLGNYLTQLEEKGFIVQDKELKYKILPVLIPKNNEQFYQFKLINNEYDQER